MTAQSVQHSFVRSQAEVAVVIPCYNYAHFLDAAIQSVLAQTVPPDEIIVVDDGSEDNTREVCSRYETVKYVHQLNRGLPGARNTGINASSAQYLLFLDADDLLERTALDRLANALRNAPLPLGAVFGDGVVVDRAGKSIRTLPEPDDILQYVDQWTAESRIAVLSTALLHRTVRSNIIPACCALIRRAVLEDVGYWNEAYRYHEDRDFWLRVLSRYPVAWIHEQVATIRRHEHNITHKANWKRNHAAILTILNDTSRAHWADATLRHLARRHFAIGAYHLAQRHADDLEPVDAVRWMGRSLLRRPVNIKAWCHLCIYTARAAVSLVPSLQRERPQR